MLYLIVPPIIIVLTLVLLLWYLSKKASDPLVNERVLAMDDVQKRARFRGVHEWGLRSLEKFAQRSKNNSLRMHNALHTWLQSIRASRKKVEEDKQLEQELNTEQEIEEEVTFFDTREATRESIREEETVQQENGSSFAQESARTDDVSRFAIPLIRRHKRESQSETQQESVVRRGISQEGVTERPMVSDRVALPDAKRSGMRGKAPEEDLIGRIATNPKDFEAYEALGDFYMENGNIKDAKECYRQVLKLSPVQRMVKIKIRRLEKLLTQKGN